jgi:hypothetical protein
MKQWRNRLLIAVAFLAGALGWLAWGPLPHPPRARLDGCVNGLWLGHRWFSGKVTDEEIELLIERLRAHSVRDLYVHVGPLDAKGAIPASRGISPGWPRIREALREFRLFAWVGGVTVYSYGVAADTVDPSASSVRSGIVETDRALLRAGFGGIHYDLEILPDGDRGFLALLDETREAIGPAALSVATPNLRPGGLPLPILWSSAYFREVARRVDQVAVMAYDTGLPTARAYSRFIAWEVGALSSMVPADRLMIGVPTYPDATLSHHPAAETLDAALDGVALSAGRCGGVALYAEWTTGPEQWARLPR